MKQYLAMLQQVLDKGRVQDDRTGKGTLSLFGTQCRYDLRQGFPLVTTKAIHFRSVVYELMWFLRGDTNVQWLQENRVRIWNEWADEDGNLGPVYGYQWRHWDTADGSSCDQVLELIAGLVENPSSRRHILSAWNVGQLEAMALPPCHLLAQFYVAENRLSCQLYQRSADLFLGVPFNIASYALLTYMLASVCDLEVGEFVHTLGDYHLYSDHLEQARLQLTRQPTKLPTLRIHKPPHIGTQPQQLPLPKDFVGGNRTPEDRLAELLAIGYDDIKLSDYNPQPHIAAAVAI